MSAAPLDLDTLAEGHAAWEAACAVRPSMRYVPGRTLDLDGKPIDPLDNGQLQFHRAPHVIRTCAPGNGWGKTAVIAVEIDWWGHGDHPWPHEIPTDRPRKMVWIAQTYKQWELIRSDIERWWPPVVVASWRGQPHFDYTWPDGSTLSVITTQTDWETVQGIQPHLVTGDEQIPKKLAGEMLMRRRGNTRTRYVFNGTATRGLNWMYSDLYLPWRRFHEAVGVGGERAMMRRQAHDYGAVDPLLAGVPGIWCWPAGGHYDNPEATPLTWAGYRARVAGFSPAEQAARLHGGYHDLNGSPVFDLKALALLKPRAGRVGDFV